MISSLGLNVEVSNGGAEGSVGLFSDGRDFELFPGALDLLSELVLACFFSVAGEWTGVSSVATSGIHKPISDGVGVGVIARGKSVWIINLWALSLPTVAGIVEFRPIAGRRATGCIWAPSWCMSSFSLLSPRAGMVSSKTPSPS